MALSADVVRQFADALNTNFTEAQAKLILALVDAASGDTAGLQDAIDDLDQRVTALENA